MSSYYGNGYNPFAAAHMAAAAAAAAAQTAQVSCTRNALSRGQASGLLVASNLACWAEAIT